MIFKHVLTLELFVELHLTWNTQDIKHLTAQVLHLKLGWGSRAAANPHIFHYVRGDPWKGCEGFENF